MRLLYTIKYFLKGFKNNIFLNLGYFLVLPLVLAIFMSSIFDMQFKSPIKTEVSPIFVTDNDKTSSSKALIEFINSDLKYLFEIQSTKDDAYLEIVIPDNYEHSIENNKSMYIDLVNLKTNNSIDVLMQNILDKYHEQIYLSKLDSDKNLDELFSKSSLTTNYITSSNNKSAKEYFAVSMLGYLILLFILNNVHIGYLSDTNGFNKRFYSMPIKRTTLLLYDCVILFLYSFVVLMLYILANRFLNMAFLGNLIPLIFICLIVSIFMSCASNFLSVFLPKKLGLPLLYILMIVQTIFGGAFFPIDSIVMQKLSPLYFITDLFNNYNCISTNSSSILICLAFSIILFLASCIKEKYAWREF